MMGPERHKAEPVSFNIHTLRTRPPRLAASQGGRGIITEYFKKIKLIKIR
jgi:hypothetical protein